MATPVFVLQLHEVMDAFALVSHPLAGAASSPPRAVMARVRGVIGMTVRALRLRGVSCSCGGRPPSPHHVLARSDDLEMSRIDAGSDTAEMIHWEVGWDGADQQFVDGAMRLHEPAVYGGLPVALSIASASPEPTGVRLVDMLPDPLLERDGWSTQRPPGSSGGVSVFSPFWVSGESDAVLPGISVSAQATFFIHTPMLAQGL